MYIQSGENSYLLTDPDEISDFLQHVTQIRGYYTDAEDDSWWYMSAAYQSDQYERTVYFTPDDEALKILEGNKVSDQETQ